MQLYGVDFDEYNMDLNSESVDVTVWCLTYNHKKYIEDAIKGFINQKCDYKVEVIIMDDHSTDGAGAIIAQYAKKYPNVIKALIARRNFFKDPNRVLIIRALQREYVRGRYVAFCEGDDCWIDRRKLQIQMVYMDNNRDCAMTVHGGIKIDFYDDSKITVFDSIDNDADLSVEDVLWYRTRMDTASMVVRRDCLQMEDMFYDRGAGDWVRQLYCAANGKVHYFDRPMSIYRYRTPDSWSISRIGDNYSNTKYMIRMLDFFKDYNDYTNKKYDKEIINRAFYFVEWLSHICESDYSQFQHFLKKLKNEIPSLNETIKEFMRYMNFYMLTKGKSPYSYELNLNLFGNRKIIIWGIGVGGERLADYLDKAGIDYYGFCVSELRDELYMDKKVFDIHEFGDTEEYIVFVGIFSISWEELRNQLERDGIRHYYFPYLFHYKSEKSMIFQ